MKKKELSRKTMQGLFKEESKEAYCLANALLGERDGTEVTVATFERTYTVMSQGELKNQKAVREFLFRQVVLQAKKVALRSENRAFQMPAKKNFRMSCVDAKNASAEEWGIENYFRCLPATARFVFVLNQLYGWKAEEIAGLLNLSPNIIDCVLEAQEWNLRKIYNTKGIVCTAPDGDLLVPVYEKKKSEIKLPEQLTDTMETIIDRLARPVEKRRFAGLMVAVVLVLVMGGTVGAAFVFAGDDDTGSTSESAGEIASEYTDSAILEETTDTTSEDTQQVYVDFE